MCHKNKKWLLTMASRIKIGKSIKNIKEQAERLIGLSDGNEARIARITEIRDRYLSNIYATAYHRKWCQERDEYSKGKSLESRHHYFEVCRRIENYAYGFVQYTHIFGAKSKVKRKIKFREQREDEAILAEMRANGQEPLGRDALLEMREILKIHTQGRTAMRRERSKANKEHRTAVYQRRKQQMIDNGEIEER